MAGVVDVVKDVIVSAARILTGFQRRRFQAQMTIEYCDGSARRAERTFGWGRQAVATGLNEIRTAIRCVENFSARGRHRTEYVQPDVVQEIHAMAQSSEASTQADPKFQTPFAFTRMTARAVREQLLINASPDRPVPAERTVYSILNRLGYRLRRVRKTIPKKKSRKPTRSSRI